jgi:plasmid stabilization system protein ParE
MAARHLTPLFTENFTANLEAIRAFLGEEGSEAYTQLLDRLFDDLLPTLRQFPQSGRSFLTHQAGSLEGRRAIRRLRDLLLSGDDLREFILDDYLVLYLIRGRSIIFLAIKHHRQLSFDLPRFWG